VIEPPSRLPPALRAFAHRDFRLFWSGQFFSLIGTWMQSVAQAWLVLELTNSPFRLGLVSALGHRRVALVAGHAGPGQGSRGSRENREVCRRTYFL